MATTPNQFYDPSQFGNYGTNLTRTAGTTGGGNPFGSIPKPINVPASTYSQTISAIPGLGTAGANAGNAINDEIMGKLSPGTLAMIRDAAASKGVSLGIPGSQFQNYDWLRSLGLTSEGLTQQGIKDYTSTLPAVASTQTDPNLAASIADRNSVYAAAPDPAAAASYAQGLFDQYLAALKTPAGGTASVGGSNVPWYLQGKNAGYAYGSGTYESAPGTFHTPAMA